MLPAYATQFRIEPERGGSVQGAADAILKEVVQWVGAHYTAAGTRPPAISEVDEIVWSPAKLLQVKVETLESGEFHKALLWSHAGDAGSFYWTTRCDLAFAAGSLDFQFQLGCDSLMVGLGVDQPLPARPKIIPQLLEHPDWRCLSGGQVLTIQPRLVTGSEVESLCDTLLFAKDRSMPLVVVSPGASGRRRYPVRPSALADRLAGAARVLQLRDDLATTILDQYLGPALATGQDCVRVFGATLSPGDHGADHWEFHGERIRSTFKRENEFIDKLFAQLAHRGLTRFQEAPALAAFRRAVAQRRQESERELVSLRDRYRTDSATYDQLLDGIDRENADLRKENAGLREAVAVVQGQVESLQGEFRAAQRNIAELSQELGRGAVANAEVSREDITPKTIAEIVVVASDQLTALEITPSAFDSAEDVPETFKFVERVRAALQALDEAARARLANSGRVGAGWRHFFSQRGFEYKTLSDTSKSQFGEEYRFLYGGRRELFEEHFTIGVGAANTCLSIHFSTTLRGDKIVVAYVGRHLRNTLT